MEIITCAVPVLLSMTAAFIDLLSDRIPNRMILLGGGLGGALALLRWATEGSLSFVWQMLLGGVLGMGLPGLLYLMGVIGAGDVKLLCMIGCFTGPGKLMRMMAAALFFAGGISVCLMLQRRNFLKRMKALTDYLRRRKMGVPGHTYLEETGADGRLHLSLPIFLGVLAVTLEGVCG